MTATSSQENTIESNTALVSIARQLTAVHCSYSVILSFIYSFTLFIYFVHKVQHITRTVNYQSIETGACEAEQER